MPPAYVSEVYHGIQSRSLPHTHGYKSSLKWGRRGEERQREDRVSDNEHGTPRSVSLYEVLQTAEQRVSERAAEARHCRGKVKKKRIDFAGRHRFLAPATGTGPLRLEGGKRSRDNLIGKQISTPRTVFQGVPMSRSKSSFVQ